MAKINIIIILLLSAALAANAQTITWTGAAANHNWNDANNWMPIGLPTSINDVIIENDSVVINAGPEIRSLTLDSAQLLILDLILICNSDNSGIIAHESTIYNEDVIEIDNVGSSSFSHAGIDLDNSIFYNNGSILILDGEARGIRADSSEFYNQGPITIEKISGRAFEISYSSQVNNYDSIFITSNENYALYLNESSEFNNNNFLKIINESTPTSSFSFYIQIRMCSYFKNQGDLICFSISPNSISRGIVVFLGSTFENLPSGTSSVRDYSSSGVLIDGDSSLLIQANSSFNTDQGIGDPLKVTLGSTITIEGEADFN